MKPLKVVLFISRNKDNKQLPNFKERRVSFLSDKSDDELQQAFDEFVQRGIPGEKSRLYRSVNNRDNEKIRKALIHYLVDHEEINMSKLDRRIASIASLKENAAEKKWLFDFDEDPKKIGVFVEDVKSNLDGMTLTTIHKTPNGYAVVVNRGFDTRELLAKWKNVELKRDDLLCIDWKTREENQ